MNFDIFKVFPPDRESAVAQITVRHDGVVDIPAEVYRENGELRITFFGPAGGTVGDYPADEWVQAVQKAIDAVGIG